MSCGRLRRRWWCDCEITMKYDGEAYLHRFDLMRPQDLERLKNSPDADKYLEEAFRAMSVEDRKAFFNFLQIDGLPEANEPMRRKAFQKRKRRKKG